MAKETSTGNGGISGAGDSKSIRSLPLQSNAMLESIMEAMTDSVTVRDLDYNITYECPTVIGLFGNSIGKKCYQVYEGRDSICDGCPVELAYRDGQVHVSTRTVTMPSGDTGIWENTACPVHDADGQVTACLEISKDITDRKQTEQALCESEEVHRRLFNEMLDGFALHEMVFDESGKPVDYRFLNVNPAFERMTGLLRKDILGKTVREALPETEQHWIDIYGNVVLTGESCRFSNYSKEIDKHFDVAAFKPKEGQFACIFVDVTAQKKAEESLRKNEEKYRLLVENANSVIVQWNADGHLTYFNNFAEKLFGYSRDEVLGKHVIGTVVPEAESTGRDMQTMIADISLHPEKYEQNINENMCKDGRRIWVAWTNRIVVNEQTGATEVLSIGADVTQQREMEEQLRQSEKSLKQMLEDLKDSQRIAHVGSWHLDIATNKVVWSEELYKMYGFDPTLPPPPYTEHQKLFTPESWSLLSTSLAKTRDAGIPYSLELQTVRKDGTNGWMWVVGEAIFNADDMIVGLKGAAQDITDRKQAESALRDSEERFRGIVNNTDAGYFFIDRQGIYQEVNAAWARMHGYDSVDEIVGQHFTAIQKPDDVEKSKAFFAGIMKGDTQFTLGEFSRKCKDGSVGYHTFSARPVERAGDIVGIDGFLIDITERKQLEEENKKNRSMLQKAEEISNQGAWEWDILSNQWTFSENWLRIHGCSAGGITREELMAIAHPDDASKVNCSFQDALAGKAEYRLEHRIIRQNDKEVRVVGALGEVLRDDTGQPVKMWGVAQDVTERKQREKTLQFLNGCGTDGKDFFKELACYLYEEMEMDFVCIDKLSEDRQSATTVAVYCDGEFEDNVSYALKNTPCGDVVGKDVCLFSSGVCDQFPKDEVLADLKADSYIGTTLWNSQGKPIGLIVAIGRKPMKSPSLCESILKIVSIRAAGEFERNQAEESLRMNEEMMRTSQSLAHICSYSTNLNVNKIEKSVWVCSPEFFNIFGIDESYPHTIEGWANLIHPDCRKEVFDYHESVVKERKEFNLEYRIIRFNDGAERWVRGTGKLEFDEKGNPVRMHGAIQDVTESKHFEEQLRQSEKMTAIGQLAGGIAHDFNNQLSGVLGYADMLVNHLEDDKLSRYATNIMKGAKRAAELTSQLLAFSRKGKNLSVPVSIHKVIGEVADILEHSIDKRIQIQQNLKATPATIMGDPNQIQNAILNLALNARDAMTQGGTITFDTELTELDENFCKSHPYELLTGSYLRISITDDGCGMDAETQKHMFEPFYTTKEQGKGTGMGLAGVYGTIVNHKGAISVYSEVGRGTTFRIHLPLAEDARNEEEDNKRSASITGTARVLLVDDEEAVREIATDMLNDLGYTVTAFNDGKEAVDHYEKSWQEIDLVLLDMVMPELGGRDTFAAMKKVNPDVRAILSSGYSINGEAQSILDDGVMAFVGKPFLMGELSEKVAQVLQGGGVTGR